MKPQTLARLSAGLLHLLASAVVAVASRPRFAHPWLVSDKRLEQKAAEKRALP